MANVETLGVASGVKSGQGPGSMRPDAAHLAANDKTRFANRSLANANHMGFDFRGYDLRGTKFDGAMLSRADFRGAMVDSDTSFKAARVDGCKIDRNTLECLADYGGLTKGDMAQMVIQDDAALLRSSFTGIWQTVHVIALLLFVTPYIAFLVRKCLEGDHLCGLVRCVHLSAALWGYIRTGGAPDSPSSLALYMVTFSLIYNVLRTVLLVKAKFLSTHQEITGLSPRFSLTGRWKAMFVLFEVSFVANIAVVAFHTWHFMHAQVPA